MAIYADVVTAVWHVTLVYLSSIGFTDPYLSIFELLLTTGHYLLVGFDWHHAIVAVLLM